MKSNVMILLLLTAIAVTPCADAARKPARAGVVKQVKSFDTLLKAIEKANVTEVERLLQEDEVKKMMNDHNEKFSPLGKVHYELEKNRLSSLARKEKTAHTKLLKTIKSKLEDNGAVLVYDSVALTSDKPVIKKCMTKMRKARL